MTDKIPSGWEEVTLSQVLKDPESGSRPKGGVSTESGAIPSIGAEFITADGRLNFTGMKYVSEEFYDRMTSGKLKKGDVLICKDGALTGKVGYYENNHYPKAAVNEHVFILRPKTGMVAKFVFYSLQSLAGQNQLKRIMTGSAQPGINTQFVKYYTLLKPTEPEQEKIAEVLTTVDAIIDATEQLIHECKKIKATELGKFSQENHLFNVSTIEEFYAVIDCKHKTPKYVQEGIPIISPSEIDFEGLQLGNAKKISEIDYLDLSEKHHLAKGDVIFSRNASMGVASILEANEPLCIGQDTVIMASKINNTRYLFYQLQSPYIQAQFRKLGAGSTFKRINLKEIRKLKFLATNRVEQDRIADKFDAFETRIHYEKMRLKALQTLKKALMQKLLSGELRVKV